MTFPLVCVTRFIRYATRALVRLVRLIATMDSLFLHLSRPRKKMRLCVAYDVLSRALFAGLRPFAVSDQGSSANVLGTALTVHRARIAEHSSAKPRKSKLRRRRKTNKKTNSTASTPVTTPSRTSRAVASDTSQQPPPSLPAASVAVLTGGRMPSPLNPTSNASNASSATSAPVQQMVESSSEESEDMSPLASPRPPSDNDALQALNPPGASDSSSQASEAIVENDPASLTGRFDTDHEFDENAGEFDYAAEGFNFHDRVLHFLRGNFITRNTRLVVEMCILIEAGSSTIAERPTTSERRFQMVHDKYIAIINGFKQEHFGESPDLQALMSRKLYNAKQDMKGERLWDKFKECRGTIRSKYMPLLPNNLATIPSGNQLRDVYNKFILDRYKECNVSFCTVTDVMLPIILLTC